jgi:asparagine synthase (glutamine-hydrolysing)
MSAVFGWIDAQRGLRGLGLRVVESMARESVRGSSGADHWLGAHAVLGVRHDAQQRCGMAIAECGGQSIVAACDGYLYDPAGPAAESLRRGSVEAEAVLSAYLRWGYELVRWLDGAFAFSVWDGRTDELVLGRDRLGIKPLSYAPIGSGWAYASEVAALAVHEGLRAELGPYGLNAVITQLRSPGRGVLHGVSEVAPATAVVCAHGRSSCRRYWSVQAVSHELSQEDTVARVRALLDNAVRRDLNGVEPAVLLSGGLDSSVLTGVTTQISGHAPRTYTVGFGDVARAVPDRPYAKEVAELWGCPHREIVVRPEELTDPSTLAAVLAAKDHPTPFGDKNISPYLLGRQVAKQSPDALSGEAADAMFGGSSRTDRQLTTFPWLERSREFGRPYGLGTGLFARELLLELDIAGHVDGQFQEALSEAPQLSGSSSAERTARTVDYLTVTRLLEQTVLHTERIAGAAGLQVRFPFADHRLFSLLYNVKPAMKSLGGREKGLLRAAGTNLVPPAVLRRPKLPYPITYDAGYKLSLIGRLRALLGDSDAPVLPLLEPGLASAYLDDPKLLDRGGWLGRADVEQVLQLDAWLRRLKVRLSL